MKRATTFNATTVARCASTAAGDPPRAGADARAHAPRQAVRAQAARKAQIAYVDAPAAVDARERQGRHPPAHLPAQQAERAAARARALAASRMLQATQSSRPTSSRRPRASRPGSAPRPTRRPRRRPAPRRPRSDAAQAAPPASSAAAQAAQVALGEQGVPYVYGGSSPSGFDCSGLVAWAFAQVGISLPHSSYALYNVGTHIAESDLQPGDLVFFNGLGHVGIYIGGGAVRARAAHRRRRARREPGVAATAARTSAPSASARQPPRGRYALAMHEGASMWRCLAM